jgi:hypothetical protein
MDTSIKILSSVTIIIITKIAKFDGSIQEMATGLQ